MSPSQASASDENVSEGTMIFVARAAQVVLLPICFFISVQVWELTEDVAALKSTVSAIEKRQDDLVDRFGTASGAAARAESAADVTAERVPVVLDQLTSQQEKLATALDRVRRRLDSYPPPDSLTSVVPSEHSLVDRSEAPQ
jgi:outer membrane murein-binding lipoprotein Lpp